MLFTNEKGNERILICNCGCGAGLHWQAGILDEEQNTYYLSFMENSWYARQRSHFPSYFRRLWKALRGQEYCLTELILKKSDVEEFAKFLNQLADNVTEGGES